MARLIYIVAVPGAQMLDVSGPLDVFSEANVQAGGKPAYRMSIVGKSQTPIICSSGARLSVDVSIEQARERPDTLLVAGAPRITELPRDPRMLSWLRTYSLSARRYGSICTGAFLLASTGLLDSRRVTTHWNVADALASTFPQLLVEKDAIYIRDGPVCTAAGVTAGMDLALALVEEDLGRETALNVASQLVMYFKRPGGQAQFSREGRAAVAGRSALQELQRWIAANLTAGLSVAELAERVGISPRHFTRIFNHEVGMPPREYVESIRVAEARRLFDTTALGPKKVATRCGFSDANSLRRAFVRRFGVTPAQYRTRFGPGD